jgi:hypothetical protein
VHQKDAQNEWVGDLCIKKMHRKKGCMICAPKRCTDYENRKIYMKTGCILKSVDKKLLYAVIFYSK